MRGADISTLTREVREIHEVYPAWTLDNAFVHWFIQAFLVADRELAARAVTGVSHDKGVDAVLVDDSVGKVFVLQGKYHQRSTAPLESRNAVVAFAGMARHILGGAREFEGFVAGMDPLARSKLEEARRRIRSRGYELHMYYVTTGKCSGPLKAEAEGEVAQASGRTQISVLDRQDILTLLADYLGGAAPPVPFLDLPIDSRGIAGSDGAVQRFDKGSSIESWILSVTAADLAAAYEHAGDRLFARNIRGFLGDTSINKGMRQTLEKSPEKFWYYNNGVTIICDSARKTAEFGKAVLRVTNPQVINGQQTTRTLSQAPTRSASVLVRVISVPRGRHTSDLQFDSLVSSIVAATNWQNAIVPSDLRSNDSRQVGLQRQFAKLGYHYIRKRQTKREAKRQLGSQHWFWVKKDELAQVVGACELDPYEVRGGKEGLFKDPIYDRLFDNRSVREYLTIYWLGRLVKYSGSGRPDRAYAKWHAMYFLWKQVAPLLRKKTAADAFREMMERNRWPDQLLRAADQVFLALLEFFRAKRGAGPKALDVSNFFYRPHQHTHFDRWWRGSTNRRRIRFSRYVRSFGELLDEAAA